MAASLGCAGAPRPPDPSASGAARGRGYLDGFDWAPARDYDIIVEMDAGWRAAETPSTFRNRRVGESKMSGAIVLEAMWRVTVWGVQRRVRRLPGSKRPAADVATPRWKADTEPPGA